jgi:hypothetical protein
MSKTTGAGAVGGSAGREKTVDIRGRASLCLDQMLEMNDPRFDCVPYIGASIGEDKPHFVHHCMDYSEVLPHVIYGMTAARQLSGSTKGEAIQQRQRELFLSLLNRNDGLVYTKDSPWNHFNPITMGLWEQARSLYALIYWYQDSKEEILTQRMDTMVASLFSLSSQVGRMRVFPDKVLDDSIMRVWGPGALIDPLLKYQEMTGSAKAGALAEGLAWFYLDERNGFFAPQGDCRGPFRPAMAAVNGISKLACLKGDEVLIDRARAIHNHAVSMCTSYGSTPCYEPACSGMELNMSALYLGRAGKEEYYDQIDRFVRNQTCEAQFLDAGEWVEGKAHKGRLLEPKFVYRNYPEDLEILPYDDYEDIIQRCIGGFMWCTPNEHSFMPASIMNCCSSHAMRSFQIVWENTLIRRLHRVDVNFHYNVDNEIGRVTSHEPSLGRVTVTLKDDAQELRIRVPEYAVRREVSVDIDGRPCDVRTEGRYICAANVRKSSAVTLNFPLCERQTTEVHYEVGAPGSGPRKVATYEAWWRGNTVTAILPQSAAEKRLYKHEHVEAPEASVAPAPSVAPGYRLSW